MKLGAASTASPMCEVCLRPSRVLRHSDRWDFDVARCRHCRTAFVVDAERLAGAGTTSHATEEIDWSGYESVARDDDGRRIGILKRLEDLLPPDRRALFDVGAGHGKFVSMARDRGFVATGNELSLSSLKYAAEVHGVELSSELLDAQPPRSVDAMTMWCVVAHVGEPRTFLTEAFSMLRPGGVLFIRTPRWCAVDSAGVVIDKLSRGRSPDLADRRMFPGHWRFYTAAGMTRLLHDVGFTEVDATPTAHYGMKTKPLLEGTGGPARLLKPFAHGLDAMIERQWVPRNTLWVYARRPAES